MARWTVVLIGLLFASLPAQGQRAFTGSVTDAESGELLVGANVALLDQDGAVVGGTSTNRDGQFSLRIQTLPAVLAIRFIGYDTKRLVVGEAASSRIDVRLDPRVGELGVVTVTPGEGPAIELMRRVIDRTRAQRLAVGPYAVTAYARSTIFAPDGSIKGVTEGLSEAFWAPGSGWREVFQAGRRTGNLGSGTGSTAAIADGMVDLLASDIEIAGHRLMGPTHAAALGTYQFEILSYDYLDGRPVATVALRPKRSTASAFIGTIQVLFDSADVLAADLEPGPAFLFPVPFKLDGARFQQQYVPVAADSSLWLPADLRSDIGIGFSIDALLSAEPFRIARTVQLSGYRLGATAPDSLLDGPAVRRAADQDSSRLEAPGVAPALTNEEADAYAAGDSLGSLNDVLVFHGPLARLARQGIQVSAGEDEPDSTAASVFSLSFGPRLHYNASEGARVGGGLKIGGGPIEASPHAAFRSEDRGITLGLGAAIRGPKVSESTSFALVGSLFDGVARRVVTDSPAIAAGLLGGPGGYYKSRSVSGGVRLALDDLGTARNGSFIQNEISAAAELRFIGETASQYEQECVACTQNIAFLGPDSSLSTQSLRLDASVGTLGVPFGILPRKALRTMVEWSPGGFVGPGYWRADAALDWRIPTFASRRALAPALDVRLAAGVSGGDVPTFRQFMTEGAVGDFGFAASTFGALRTQLSPGPAGDMFALVAWEHSFRTLPFEALGLDGLTARSYNFIVHGAHAWTRNDALALTRPHHELGVSLSGLLGGLRVDVTQRLDEPATVFGLGVARVF